MALQFCPNCETERQCARQDVEKPYTIRGCTVAVRLPHYVCSTCGVDFVDPAIDAARQVYDEVRKKEGLLFPSEIAAIRARCQLTQEALAKLLGMSPATISRYERGALQDEPNDNLLRACQRDDFMLELLRRRGHLLPAEQAKRATEALTPSSRATVAART